MMKTARVNKKRAREADAEPAGPKAKRCTDCTSTESVDRCESIFHEAGAKAPSGPDDGEIELATGPTAAASATAAAGNLAKASRGAKASKSSASVTSAEEAGASKGGPTNASGGAAKSKSRRLVWNERMHVKFLSIIFDIGLEHASPRKILDRWGLFERGSLDSGHVKSHLQKYRSNSKRTKEVFSEQLEAALKQACDDQINVQHSYPFPRGTKTPISALDMKAIMDEDHDCPFVPCPSIEDMQKGLIMQRPHSFADPHENGEPCLHQGALDPVGPTSSSSSSASSSSSSSSSSSTGSIPNSASVNSLARNAQRPMLHTENHASVSHHYGHLHYARGSHLHGASHHVSMPLRQDRPREHQRNDQHQLHLRQHHANIHGHHRHHHHHHHAHGHGNLHHPGHSHGHVLHAHGRGHGHSHDEAMSDAIFADCLECLLSPAAEPAETEESSAAA